MLVQIRSFLPELCQGCPSSTEAKQSGGKDGAPGDPRGLGRPTRELGRENVNSLNLNVEKKGLFWSKDSIYQQKEAGTAGFTAL